MLKKQTSLLWKLLPVLVVFFSFLKGDIQATPTIVLGTENGASTGSVSAAGGLTWNFRIAAAAGSLIRLDKSHFRIGKAVGTTEGLTFTLYSGLGGNTGGNAMIAQTSLTAAQVDASSETEEVFSFAEQLLLAGDYSVTLTSTAATAGDGYTVKLGRLAVYDAAGYVVDAANTLLSSLYWIQDARDAGDADANFNTNGGQVAGGSLMVADVGLFNGPAVTDPALADDQVAAVDFGNMVAGSTIDRVFTVRNDGAGGMTGISVSFTGTGAAQFSLQSAPAATLAAGATTNFTVRFQSAAATLANAQLVIASNDPDENPFNVPLTARAQSAPVISNRLAVSQSSTAATLTAQVNPGGAVTTVSFQYSTSAAFDVGLVTTSLQSIGSGTSPVNVSAPISSLNPNSVYYWRVVATNSLNTTTSSGLALLKVAMMPSYAQNPTYANALINTSINVWGRVWGGTAPFTYRMSYGDGTADTTGTVSNVKYITAPHTFTTAGSKTVTLTVTDSTGASSSRSSVVRVLPTADLDERSNIAIEKALVYLYNSALELNTDRIYWYQSNSDYGFGTTGACVLSFEEQGHLPGNDSVEWVYTDTVRRGLNFLLGVGAGTNYGALQNIADHTDGIAVRDVDEDNDGKGAYLWNGGHGTYVNSFAGMAVIFAYRNPAAAQASIIPSGPFINMSYYDVVIDLLDTFRWSMGDGAVRGGYEYTVTAATGSRYDGSSQQWPVLCYKAALDRLKITPPTWYLDNMVHGFKQVQNANGGVGYESSSSWVNTAKTGGLLTGMAFSGRFQGVTEVDIAVNYLQTYWDANRSGSGTVNAGWAGNWYSMYGIKKGLTLQGITHMTVGGVSRDWKKEMTAWLLGDATQLPATLSPAYRSTNDMFGQLADGRWISQDWPSSTSYNDLNTAHGVLILSASVTQAPPVPVIGEVGEQSNKPGFRSFTLSAAGSYHLDPDRAIVEYLWDWNAADGLNWTTPDATGSQVTNPGYATTGTYTVTLRVKDNNDPALIKTSTVQVTVVATDVAPVAVALPLGGFQGYAGKVGQPITLDGSNSYDPDGDPIVSYSWDLNGDGIYGDATGVTVTVTYNTPYVGSLGLRVTANGKTSNNTAVVDIQAADADISLGTVTLSNIVPRTSADFSIQISNDPGSGQSFNNVVLRIYNGNPYAGGGAIGIPYLVNLPSGTTTTVNLTGVNLGGATTAWVYLDSTQAVIEANEANNAAGPFNVDQLPADISVEYPTGTVLTSGSSTVVIPEVVLAGQSGTPITFTVRNDGEANLENLVITKAGTNPADFTVSALGSTTVAGASFTTYTVTFTPTGYLGGTRAAVLQIASNDPNENPFLINIQAKARLTVIPVAKDAGKDIVTENPVKGADGVSEIGLYDILRRGGFVAENGTVVFPGSLIVGSGSPAVTVNNSQGIWKAGTTGNVWMIARTGETVPDAAGTTFDYLPIVPGINEDGEVTLLASLRIGTGGVTSANDTGVWSEIGGSSMRLLAREGDAVPGLPGVFIKTFCAGVYATAKTAADKGDAMYSVTFGGASTTTAIVRNRVDSTLGTVSMQVVARENSPAPGTAENFGNLMGSFSDPARMDATGNAVFAAMTKTNKEGIWYHAVGNTGAPVRAVFTGDVAPGTGGATFSRIQRPTMGSNSVISFRGMLNRNGDNTGGQKGDGIWRGSAATGTYTCVLRSGDSGIAGMPVGSKVGNTWGGWLTNQNHGAWKTWLDVNGDGVSKAPTDVHALFTDVSGTMRMVVKVGDAAPGITGATFSSLEIPMVGGQEQMIFLGKVTGPGIVAGVNDKGLWRQESNGGELELVLRSGDPLGTTLHGMKTVSTIDFPGSDTTSTTDRRWEQLVIDGDGNIVVLIIFTDGTSSQAMVPAGL
jgi:hypothetical protein